MGCGVLFNNAHLYPEDIDLYNSLKHLTHKRLLFVNMATNKLFILFIYPVAVFT